MVHRLFERFLEDPKVYLACERYWETLVEKIASSLGQNAQWVRWIPRHWANGTPMDRDGNPIFDGRNDQLGRAFRIVQYPLDDELAIDARVQPYGKEYKDWPHSELFINLSLSEESASITEDLLRKWMTPETSLIDMERFIDERVWPESRQPPK